MLLFVFSYVILEVAQLYIGTFVVQGREVLVVAGNFSLDGELVNLAEYDISAGS